MNPTIQCASGAYFNFALPDESMVKIEDIAHALSRICRFNGHVRDFYSVAQHSVLVSEIVPREFALVGLLHDAHEAYVGDMASPLKVVVSDYRAVEDRVASVVRRALDITEELPEVVKYADLVAMRAEHRDLFNGFGDAPWEWACISNVIEWPQNIHPLPPRDAFDRFMDRYDELTKGRVLK